jgi:hypothetical protein
MSIATMLKHDERRKITDELEAFYKSGGQVTRIQKPTVEALEAAWRITLSPKHRHAHEKALFKAQALRLNEAVVVTETKPHEGLKHEQLAESGRSERTESRDFETLPCGTNPR